MRVCVGKLIHRGLVMVHVDWSSTNQWEIYHKNLRAKTFEQFPEVVILKVLDFFIFKRLKFRVDFPGNVTQWFEFLKIFFTYYDSALVLDFPGTWLKVRDNTIIFKFRAQFYNRVLEGSFMYMELMMAAIFIFFCKCEAITNGVPSLSLCCFVYRLTCPD